MVNSLRTSPVSGCGKGDERLFGAAQVERGLVFAHCLLKAFDAAVHVRVEQSEETAEMVGIALVRRGRHQEEVVGHLRQVLAQSVGVGLVVLAAGTHLVSLVDDHQIPARSEQAFAGVFDHRYPGDRRDDLVALLPRVLAVVGSQNVAADDVEPFAELVGQFALPLEGEVRRRDDQHPPHEAAGLEFLEQQPRHDRLAGARIVGQAGSGCEATS